MLVVRTNAGYERWWEGRKLWGGIVNQSRNLALIGLAHGPADAHWREQFIRWTAAFAWTAKAGLRGETDVPELAPLLGEKEAAHVQAAEHMPSCVALQIDELLRKACQGENGLDRFAFLQAERERAGLIDHLGGCERIRKYAAGKRVLRSPSAASSCSTWLHCRSPCCTSSRRNGWRRW